MEVFSTVFSMFLKGFAMVGAVMFLASYSVLAERKIAARIQRRPGPNRTALPFISAIPIVGPFLTRLGLFQPVADGVKFLFKEEIIPGHVNKFYYILAPCISLVPALVTMVVLPFGVKDGEALVLANVDIGFLFILSVASLGIYGIILGGWASNSKYPFLGGLRASAQMISYELAMVLSILPVFMWANAPGTAGGFNLFNIAQAQGNLWLIFWQPLSALIFLITLFVETNRLPFDMPESETDLVAGYNTEYGAFKFGFFFLGEYSHMVIGSAVFTVLFLGGWNIPFIHYPAGYLGAVLSVLVFLIKTFFLLFFFIWIRWTLPRFRYDQIMNMGWKILLPFAMINLVFNAILIAMIHACQSR
jgi:NADH-quinone oxidoreductase subunit H